MWNKISHAILNVAIVTMAFTIVASCVVGLSYWRQWAMPPEAWGEYSELRAANWNIKVGEELWMISRSDWRRLGLKVKWNDILRCKHESTLGYYAHFSNFTSRTVISNITSTNNKPWKYQGTLPTRAMECKIESQMEFIGAFGIKKHYSFESESINFIG